MKKILFLLILAVVLFSTFFNIKIDCPEWGNCGNYINISNENISEINENSDYDNKDNSSFFLGLGFGMSFPETFNILLKLKNQDIISEIETGYGILSASYSMNYLGYSNIGKIYCFYNQYHLQELQIDTLEQRSGNLLELFINKYGCCDYFAKNKLNKEYRWIIGCRHITIFAFNNSDRLLIQFTEISEKIKNSEINLLRDWGLTIKV